MRILTYNAHLIPLFQWFGSDNLKGIKKRKHKIRQLLKNNGYDVILIQEDFTRDIAGIHGGSFPPTGLTIGLPKFKEKDAKKLLKPKKQVERYDKFGYESGDWLTRKGYLITEYEGIRFITTHLDAGDGDAKVRKHQLGQLAKKLLKMDRKRPMRTIVAGDFNPESRIERTQLFDLFGELGYDCYKVPNRKNKDFIFVKGLNVTQVGEDTELSELSDHPAIWVDVENI